MLSCKQLLWLLLLSAIAFICQSCRHCRSDELPVLQLTVQMQEDDMYSLSSDLLERSRPFMNNQRLELPLALNADTTVYDIFNREGKRWRLTMIYDRRTGFESSGCGFYMDMTDLQVLSQPVFSSIEISSSGSQWSIWVIE